MSVMLLTEQHLEFLSLKGGCTGSSESTLVKIPHCWKSHVAAHIKMCYKGTALLYNTGASIPHFSSCCIYGSAHKILVFIAIHICKIIHQKSPAQLYSGSVLSGVCLKPSSTTKLYLCGQRLLWGDC